MNSPKTDEFAIIFMTELAKSQDGALVSLAQVAHNHSISVLYLKKIVRALRKSGLVDSKEGVGGGYVLSRRPEAISVWDVIASLNVNKRESTRLPRQYCPLNKSCLPQHINTKINESIMTGLKNISIQSLIV